MQLKHELLGWWLSVDFALILRSTNGEIILDPLDVS